MKNLLYLNFIILLLSCNNSNSSFDTVNNEETPSEVTKEANNTDSYSKSNQEEQSEDIYEGEKCSNCNFGKYYDGICSVCNAASPSKVEEVYSNMPTCKICYGDGTIEDSYGEITCDYCDGTGKQRF